MGTWSSRAVCGFTEPHLKYAAIRQTEATPKKSGEHQTRSARLDQAVPTVSRQPEPIPQFVRLRAREGRRPRRGPVGRSVLAIAIDCEVRAVFFTCCPATAMSPGPKLPNLSPSSSRTNSASALTAGWRPAGVLWARVGGPPAPSRRGGLGDVTPRQNTGLGPVSSFQCRRGLAYEVSGPPDLPRPDSGPPATAQRRGSHRHRAVLSHRSRIGCIASQLRNTASLLRAPRLDPPTRRRAGSIVPDFDQTRPQCSSR